MLINRDGTIAYIGHLASDALDTALAAMIAEDASTSRVAQTRDRSASDPALTINLLDETRFRVGGAMRKPVVLFFLATWCDWYLAETRPAMSADCTAFQERIGELHERFGDQFHWVGIAQSLWTNTDDLREFQTRLDISYPLGLDTSGEWFKKYDIRDVPTVIVLDERGEILSRIDGDVAELDAALDAALAEK